MNEQRRLEQIRKKMSRLDLAKVKADQRVAELELERRTLMVEYQRILTKDAMEEGS
jgi:hypothetical protein